MVAEKAHGNQLYDIYPYTYHLKQVAQIAKDLGYDENIQVACVLHDILEDTELSYNDLKRAFGEEIAEIVYCVTDEMGRNRKERKAKTYPKIKGNWKATVVKICDRIANIREAKLRNARLLKMYMDEHEEFVKNLKNSHNPETAKAWEMLEDTINFEL